MAKQNVAASAAGKEVATPGASAVVAYDEKALAALQTTDADFAQFDGERGSLPFLLVLQALSPACTLGKPDYNESARPGMLMHSITKELFKDPVALTPVAFTRTFNEWVPRLSGGGFRGAHPVSTHEALFNKHKDPKTGKAILPAVDGVANELIETRAFFCLLNKADGTVEPVVVNMALSQSKAANDWIYMQKFYSPPGLERRRYPSYAATYLMSTKLRQKDQNTWFVWNILRSGPTNPELFGMAQAFAQEVRGNNVVVDYAASGSDEAPAAGGPADQM